LIDYVPQNPKDTPLLLLALLLLALPLVLTLQKLVLLLELGERSHQLLVEPRNPRLQKNTQREQGRGLT
jgi:hypothetical protein